ncbi:MAG: sulfite exporter TauE/SafE family protein, partial [Myxococcota bacterium]
MEPTGLAIAFAVVLIGSAVQGAAGFGLGLIAAPVLLLLDPRWVPGPLMASGVTFTILVAYKERADIDLMGLRFA